MNPGEAGSFRLRRRKWRPCGSLLGIGLASLAAVQAAPLVRQLQVVSIHVRDEAAFNAVFGLLREVLELPLLYGEPAAAGSPARRHYAGFSVGNAYLEPCGPYSSDPPFPEGRPMRFHGLTFTAADSLPACAEELTRGRISYSPLGGEAGSPPRFLVIKDPALVGPKLAVSLWQARNQEDQAGPARLGRVLREARGGALGVRRLAEVRIGWPEGASRTKWQALCVPAELNRGYCALGEGPALRLLPDEAPGIRAILLEVESLPRARRFLAARQLLGAATETEVALDAARVWGLQIVLREAAPPARERP